MRGARVALLLLAALAPRTATAEPHTQTHAIHFDRSRTPAQLVGDLVAADGDVEFRNAQASFHGCAALFTDGHAAGVLMERDNATGALLEDGAGNHIPSATPIVPDRGVILSTGSPLHFSDNDRDWSTTMFGQFGGDADLKATVDASNGFSNTIYDACVLEFEFRCTSNAYVPHVEFKYIWGSDEYNEYVGSFFNDVFGFYLNGENIARIYDSDTDSDVVSINNINYASNTKYFNHNDPGTGWHPDPAGAPEPEVVYPTVEADGFTTVLTAYGSPKDDAGEWNTLKLAVGDVGDFWLDSWVLLESTTFTCRSLGPDMSFVFGPGPPPTDRRTPIE